MTERRMPETVRNKRSLILCEDATVAEARTRCMLTGRDAVRVLASRHTPDSPIEAVVTRSPNVMIPCPTAIDALRLIQDDRLRSLLVVDTGQVLSVGSWGDFRGSEHDRLDTDLITRRHSLYRMFTSYECPSPSRSAGHPVNH